MKREPGADVVCDYSIHDIIQRIVDGENPSIVLTNLQARIEHDHDVESVSEMSVSGLLINFDLDSVVVTYPGGGTYRYVLRYSDIDQIKKYYKHAGGRAVRKIKELAIEVFKKVGNSWTRL